MRKLLAVAALLAASTTANAAITVFFDSSAGGVFNYHIEQAEGDEIVSGDFFTIYDFGPNTLVSAPTGWNYASNLSDADPFGIDDASILNVTFTSTATTSQSNIGPFVLQSPYTGPAIPNALPFLGRNTDSSDGSKNGSFGDVAGPQNVVPEPASMGLMGGALLGLGLLARRRK